MNKRRAIIIGGGPAGLTAAYELLERTDVKPIVLEQDDILGGIARTVNYKGNRMDIGGHRFFSKSDRVMDWWLKIMPLQSVKDSSLRITYQNSIRELGHDGKGPDPDKVDRVMLVRKRKSRIFFIRKFFDYPISISIKTIKNLGPGRMTKIGMSYVKSSLFPINPESNLEQFFINRFGRELYATFFQSYTEKVWGVPCQKIDASWGAQRIKGLSVTKAVAHAVKKVLPEKQTIRQKNVETTLIEKFLYPKLGPGQMWELVAEHVSERGGEVHMNQKVKAINAKNGRIVSVETVDAKTGELRIYEGDFFFSSMPIKELMRGLKTEIPSYARDISEGLLYRDFIAVGLLVNKLLLKDYESTKSTQNAGRPKGLISDNWIYIQEPDVQLGRLQIFNNWSPYLVSDPDKVWLGLEYFCNESDSLWSLCDADMIKLAKSELSKIGIIREEDALDATVLRMPKTYPCYFGTYDRFDELRGFLDGFKNLFLVGRNGMHKYNNQDHAMLTSMVAVDNIAQGIESKDNIWAVNTELEYHEEKS